MQAAPSNADVIARALHGAGCRLAFGIPGGEVLSMIDALDRVEPKHRSWVLYELVQLAQTHMGEDVGPWRTWAYSIP